MAEIERPHLDDSETKRGFASAFEHRLGGKQQSDRRLGPRIWAVGVAVVVVAAIAVGIGFLTRPHPPAPPVSAKANHVLPTTTTTTTTVGQSPFAIPQQVPQPNVGAGIPAAAFAGGGLPMAPAMPPAPAPMAPAPAPNQPGPVAPAPQPPPATFSATTGYGCGESASLVFTQHGFYSSGNNGWIRVGSGGPNAGGCNNTFDAMPMSGSATTDDPSNYATWQFRTGAVRSGTCRVSIWIPNDSDIEHVGGHPSTYLLYDSFTPSGTPFAVQVDQTANRGKWATATVHIGSGSLSVKLLSRGIDWTNSGPDHAHHAVSAVHVDCTA